MDAMGTDFRRCSRVHSFLSKCPESNSSVCLCPSSPINQSTHPQPGGVPADAPSADGKTCLDMTTNPKTLEVLRSQPGTAAKQEQGSATTTTTTTTTTTKSKKAKKKVKASVDEGEGEL